MYKMSEYAFVAAILATGLALILYGAYVLSGSEDSTEGGTAYVIDTKGERYGRGPQVPEFIGYAGTGAFSIRVGESPILAIATTRARGFRPCFSA